MTSRRDSTFLNGRSWNNWMSIQPIKWMLLGFLLALWFQSRGFGAELPLPPRGQPAEVWSRVDYDPELSDPFFNSSKWSYPEGGRVVTGGIHGEQDAHRLKHTANCFSTSFGSLHLVRFCEAKFLGINRIDLSIDESNPVDEDSLNVRIRNGMFTSEYWTVFRIEPRTPPGATWTTKRQKLTVDKKVYRKGDVIKGRIDFECVQQITDPMLINYFGKNPTTIKVYGVFKTIVQ